MADATEPTVNEAVEFTNKKVLGEVAAFYAAQRMAAATAESEAMGAIRQAVTSRCVDTILGVGPAEAISAQKMLSGSDLGQHLSALLAALGSGQQVVKTAGTTPPVTV